jgi:CheY-like chemotaxis protein
MSESRHYLVVDDNHAFAENLAEILGDVGATVDTETVGSKALARAAHTKYDALVSDMRMPVMGGAELVNRMRQLDPGLPVVVVTAYTSADELDAVSREGVLAVLPKPLPMGRLIELLASAHRDGLVVTVGPDRKLRDEVVDALRTHGFSAVTAATAHEVEQIGQVAPFVAIVDQHGSGGADGVAVSLARRFPGLPVLVEVDLNSTPPARHDRPAVKPFDAVVEAVERLYRESADAFSSATI